MSAWLKQARKFLAALTGAAGVAISAGLLNGPAERWVSGGLAIATAFVVYLVPNAPAVPVVPAKPQSLVDPAAPWPPGGP